MSVNEQIRQYIGEQEATKRADMQVLHQFIMEIMPGTRLWFLDGKNEEGKMVSNPNIGYGSYMIHYASGASKDFFQVGISANQTGISVYIMGIKDKNHLPQAFGKKIGKASVTGYCIKFKSLKDIKLEILEEAIRYGIQTSGHQ